MNADLLVSIFKVEPKFGRDLMAFVNQLPDATQKEDKLTEIIHWLHCLPPDKYKHMSGQAFGRMDKDDFEQLLDRTVAALTELETFERMDEEVTAMLEGSNTCPSCGDFLIFYSKQTRSADEGPTVFAKCQNCTKGGNKFN